MKYRWLIGICAAGTVVCGCSNHNVSSASRPTSQQFKASEAAAEQHIKEVENNPSIPDGAKEQILARLKGNLERTEQVSGVKPAQ